MANLKLDLVNKINNDKFYAELELVRLAQDPNMNYRLKIESMDHELDMIAKSNAKLALTDQYFQEQPSQPQPQFGQQPQHGQPKNGQSHGE